MKRSILIALLFAAPLFAQTGTQGASGTARRVTKDASLPATCTVGDVFFKTTATVGTYQCLTTDAWTAVPTSGGVSGSLGATDNAVLRADGVGGATAQGSALVIGDVSGASLPVSTTAGNALAVSATAPAPAAGASQVGVAASLTASPAVASTDTAGAAAGGAVTLTSGAAARLTSGNANGGDINIVGGAGIGTGTTGKLVASSTGGIQIPAGSATAPGLFVSNGSVSGIYSSSANNIDMAVNNTHVFEMSGSKLVLNSGGVLAFSNTTNALSANADTGISRDAAGVVQFNGGTAGTTKGSIAIIADANGSKRSDSSATELLTLSTSGTTTNTAGNLGVANSDIEAILARVTTTITTATNWSVAVTTGITSCTNAWVAIGGTTTAQTGLTAGTTVIFKPAAGLQCHVGTASTLTVTTTGTPGAGAIRLTPIVKTYTAPTS